jgi:excisionase family DNA binding protein
MECEFYSIKETAVIFGVNEVTIRRAIRNGFIVAIRIGNSKKSPYRISRKSIEEIHNSIIFKHSLLANKRIS